MGSRGRSREPGAIRAERPRVGNVCGYVMDLSRRRSRRTGKRRGKGGLVREGEKGERARSKQRKRRGRRRRGFWGRMSGLYRTRGEKRAGDLRRSSDQGNALE